MKRSLKKLIAVVIAMSLMLALFAGCSTTATKGTQEVKTNEVAQTAKPSEPTPYKPKIDQLVVMAAQRTLPDENPTKTWLEEQVGVKFKFINSNMSSAEHATQLKLLIASNQIPDVLMDNTAAEYISHMNEGLFIEIEPLLKAHAPDVLKARDPQNIQDLRWKDGKLYVISASVNPGYEMLLLRNNWLTKLNLKAPVTIDEFTEVLKAFTRNDPDGNGQDDTYGLGGYEGMKQFVPIFAAFGANPLQWILKDGKIVHGAVQPEMKEAVKYLNMLYKEGLVDKDFVANNFAKHTELIGNEKWGIWQDQASYADKNYSAYHKNPETEIIGIAPPKGPKGKAGYISLFDPVAKGLTGITTSCKDPIIAAKYLNFIADEKNSLRISGGIEGVHYTFDKDGYRVFTDKYKADNNLLLQEGIAPSYAIPFMAKSPMWVGAEPPYVKYLTIRRQYEKDFYGAIYEPIPQIVEKKIGTGWENFHKNTIHKLITEGSNIDTAFDELVKTLNEKYGMAEQEKLANEYYNDVYKNRKK